MDVLSAWRFVQGVSAGAAMSATLVLLSLLFPPRERGIGMTWFSGALAVAAVMGPLLGGVLTDMLSWHWIFYINVPLALLGLIMARVWLPDLAPGGNERLDVVGALLLLAWTVPLQLALASGGSTLPWTSPTVIALLVLAFAGVMAFARFERTSAAPLFDMTLFAETFFRYGAAAMACLGAVQAGLALYLPLLLVNSIGADMAGVVLTPMLLGVFFGSRIVSRYTHSTGLYRRMLVLGVPCVFLPAVALPAVLTLHVLIIAADVALLGLGLGLLFPTIEVAIQNCVERARQGTAASATEFFRQLGAALAVAVLGTHLSVLLKHAGVAANSLGVGSPALVGALRFVYLDLAGLAALAMPFVLGMPEVPLKAAISDSRDRTN